MIKSIMTLSLALALMTAHTATVHAQEACNTLKTDSITFAMENKFAECKITVDAPSGNESDLTFCINAYIHEMLQSYQLGIINNMTATVDKNILTVCGKKRMEEMCNEAKELYGDKYPTAPYSYEANIRKTYEDNKIVTYISTIYTYSGGAHPITSITGTTITKESCVTINYNSFSQSGLNTLKNLVKTGLKEYFDVTTDKELKDMLFVDDINNIPLPASSPFFTKDGLTVMYSQYEIAPYAAGMPTVVIPYNKAKALLSDASLIK